MFIASAFYRSKLRDSGAHATREDAARELFAAFPSLTVCGAARAYQNGRGEWKTAGSDSRTIYRRNLGA